MRRSRGGSSRTDAWSESPAAASCPEAGRPYAVRPAPGCAGRDNRSTEDRLVRAPPSASPCGWSGPCRGRRGSPRKRGTGSPRAPHCPRGDSPDRGSPRTRRGSWEPGRGRASRRGSPRTLLRPPARRRRSRSRGRSFLMRRRGSPDESLISQSATACRSGRGTRRPGLGPAPENGAQGPASCRFVGASDTFGSSAPLSLQELPDLFWR